jgi:hypothetical protein
MKVLAKAFVLMILMFTVGQASAGNLIIPENKKIEGGIGGGGGDVHDPYPVDMDWIRAYLGNLRFRALGYFNARDYSIGNPQLNPETRSAEWMNVFRESPTVFEAADSMSIELKLTGRCKDADGNDVDGSIYGVEPGNICLSAEAIMEKTNYDTFEVAVGGLIIHEMIHLAGGGEEFAVSEQNISVVVYGKVADYTYMQFSPMAFWSNLVMGVEQYNLALDRISSFDSACVRVSYMIQGLDPALRAITIADTGLTVLAGEPRAQFWAKYYKAYMLRNFVCSQDKSESLRTNLEAQRILDIGFGSAEELELTVYFRNLKEKEIDYGYRSPDRVEIVQRPHTLADAILGLKDVEDHFRYTYMGVERIFERKFPLIEE